MGSVSRSITTSDQQRPRLLHNWAASLLTIAQKTYQQAEHFHGPVGSITRALASVATPILDPIQHQCLSILSTIDDKILTVEDIAMTVFPPSAYLVSLADELALLADTLPKRFEDAIDTLAFVVQPVLSVMGRWERRDHDRDTTVDVKCDEKKMVDVPAKEGVGVGEREVVLIEKLDGAVYERKLSKREEEEIKEVEEACNEIIEELGKMGIGSEEEEEEVKADGGDHHRKGAKGEEGGVQEVEKGVGVAVDDPVMALFEHGWAGKNKRER